MDKTVLLARHGTGIVEGFIIFENLKNTLCLLQSKKSLTVTMFDRMPKVAPTSALGAVACFQILGSVFLPLTKLLALPDALADNSLGLILANLDCIYHLNSVFLLTSIILFNTTSLNGQPPPINHSTNSKPR